jgi:mannose-6-phosphate isomerase-like protein (cupin superfamily)
MMKGWARFMYEDKVTLVSEGDCLHQRPGIVHYLFDYSHDMEYLEIVGPAEFGSVAVAGPEGVAVPAPTKWPKELFAS